MAHILRVTDGTTTVNLADGTQITAEYIPMSGEIEVKEQVHITFASASGISTNVATMRTLNNLFAQAKRWNDSRIGNKVYVEFDPGTSGTVMRSLLIEGVILGTKDTLGAGWANNFVDVTIAWRRVAYWEGALTEISLSNASGSGTGGIGVTNHNNGAYENFVDIGSASIVGDVPAPVRLEMKHTYSLNPYMESVSVYHKVESASSFTHVLEAESSASGTTVVDANASGGNKKSFTWTGTSKAKLCDMTLPAAFFDAAAFQKYLIHAVLDGMSYSDLYLQIKFMTPAPSALVAESTLVPVQASNDITPIDIMRLPPGRTNGTNSSLIIELWAQRLTAGSHTIYLDFLHFSALSDNSWEKYTNMGNGIKYNETLVSDSIEEYVYRLASSTRVSDMKKNGKLRLVPGKDQRLYFLAVEQGGNFRKLQTFTVRAYYRPRYRMI